MQKNTGKILLIVMLATSATAVGVAGSVAYVKNEEAIKEFVVEALPFISDKSDEGGFDLSKEGEDTFLANNFILSPDQTRPGKKDCGDSQGGYNLIAFNSCVRDAFINCTPAVFTMSGGGDIKTYRITGKKGDNCILYNSAGSVIKDINAKDPKDIFAEVPILCTIPLRMIDSMKSQPPYEASDMSSGDIFTDSLVYLFGRELKIGKGANPKLPGSENLECHVTETENISETKESSTPPPPLSSEAKIETNKSVAGLTLAEGCGTVDDNAFAGSTQQQCLATKAANCAPGKLTVTYGYTNNGRSIYKIIGPIGGSCKTEFSFTSDDSTSEGECSFPLEGIKKGRTLLGTGYGVDDTTAFLGLQIIAFMQGAAFNAGPFDFYDYKGSCTKK